MGGYCEKHVALQPCQKCAAERTAFLAVQEAGQGELSPEAWAGVEHEAQVAELNAEMSRLNAALSVARLSGLVQAKCEVSALALSALNPPEGPHLSDYERGRAWGLEQAEQVLDALLTKVIPAPVTDCRCTACLGPFEAGRQMVLCALCGNKRCPHANHHDNDCTKSNKPGQAGSAYVEGSLAPSAAPNPTKDSCA